MNVLSHTLETIDPEPISIIPARFIDGIRFPIQTIYHLIIHNLYG